MYREGKTYDRIDRVIIDVIIDYGINSFPINVQELCSKMKIELIPYSECDSEVRNILRKKSKDGVFQRPSKTTPAIIYFNDRFVGRTSVRFTLCHELAHFVLEDSDDSKDDIAEYFARHFLCPTSYLLLKGIESADEIAEYCGVSKSAAKNAASNIKNRKEKYGNSLFSYEVPLIEHLEPELMELVDKIIEKEE